MNLLVTLSDTYPVIGFQNGGFTLSRSQFVWLLRFFKAIGTHARAVIQQDAVQILFEFKCTPVASHFNSFLLKSSFMSAATHFSL